MSFKKVLHNEDGLEVTFIVDEDLARLEFRANAKFNLSSGDDVVIVVDGKPVLPECESESFASADLGSWAAYSPPVSLMVRVGEFFEGWDLE